MKRFFEHYSGIKVANDGEVFVPFIHKYPEHYTFGTKLKSGHLGVTYKGKHYLIHRLVAEVFLNGNKPIPEGYDVHHISGDKTENRVENLVILTHGEHMQLHNKDKTFSEDTRRKISESKKGENHPMYGKLGKDNPSSKLVISTNKETGDKVTFFSIMDASRALGISATHISACCQGKRKSAGGYIWRYA